MSMKVEVGVLGFPVPNSQYGLCGRKATLNLNLDSIVYCVRAQELRESRRRGRPGLPVPNSPYDLCGSKTTLKQKKKTPTGMTADTNRQSPGEIKRREASWTLTKTLDAFAGLGEIKRREVVVDPQVSPEEIKSRDVDLGLRVGLLSLRLFPNGGATDIVFVTLFCIAVGTAIAWCGGRCAMPDGHSLIFC